MSTETAPKGASIASDGALALANDADAETTATGGKLRTPKAIAGLPPPRPRLPTLEGLAPPVAPVGIADFDDPTNPDEAEWELTSELRAKPLPSQAEVAPTLPSSGLASFASDERATEPMAAEADDNDDLDDSDLTSVYVRPEGSDDDEDFNDDETFVAPMPSDAVPTAPKQLPPLAAPMGRALPPPPRSIRAATMPLLGVPARPSVLPPPPLGGPARANALPAGLLGMTTRPAAAPPPPPPPGSMARPSALLPPPGSLSRAPAPPPPMMRPPSVPPPPGGSLRAPVPAPPTARSRSVLPPAQLTRSSAPPPPPVGGGTLPPPPRSSSPPPALHTAPPPPRTPGWVDHPQNSPFAVKPLTAPVARPSAPPPPQGSSIAPVALGHESFPTFSTPFALPPKRLVQLGAVAVLAAGLLGAVVVLVKQPSSAAAGAKGDGLVTVTVTGDDGDRIGDLSVVADDVVRCTSSPCKVTDLAAGTHFIRVTANGYTATAARAVAVTDDNQPKLHFQLSRIAKPVAAKVHEPEAAPSEAAPPEAATPATTNPPVDLDADEASAGSSRATEAAPVRAARTRAPSSSRAKSAAAEEPKSRTKAKAAIAAAIGADETPPHAKPAVEPEEASPAALSQLNINSTPSTSVVLDGRPLGRTPLSGVKVSPGAHTIVFIGPDGKRKVGSATVKPGASRSIAVKF